jgi:hypothetical protein
MKLPPCYSLVNVLLFQEVKVTSPDYMDMNKDDAVHDFKKRIHHYETLYEPLNEEHDKEMSYIRIYNQGERYLVNRVQGLQSLILLCDIILCLRSCRPCSKPRRLLSDEHPMFFPEPSTSLG